MGKDIAFILAFCAAIVLLLIVLNRLDEIETAIQEKEDSGHMELVIKSIMAETVIIGDKTKLSL